MFQLVETVPVVLFFLTYLWYDFLVATWVLMGATAVLAGSLKLMGKPVSVSVKFLLVTALILGALTLVFDSPRFLQWRSTLVPWTIALVLGLSQVIGNRNLLERMLDRRVPFARSTWRALAWLWIVGFGFSGSLNLLVVYFFSETFWVTYRLVSGFAFSLVMVVLSCILLHRRNELSRLVEMGLPDSAPPDANERENK